MRLGACPGCGWAHGRGRLNDAEHGLQSDQEQAGPKKRERAAPTCLCDLQACLVFSQEVDLNLGLAALLSMLLPALAQTRRLMTKPMHVR